MHIPFQKAVIVIGLVNDRGAVYSFVGLRDVNQNDVMVSIGSGTVFPDSSEHWYSGHPSHTTDRDCVSSTTHYNGKLIDEPCTSDHAGYICEKY